MSEETIVIFLSVASTVILLFGYLIIRETNRIVELRSVNDRLNEQIHRREFIIGEMEQVIKELREDET